MFKKAVSFTLIIILILSCSIYVSAEKPIPTFLEKPQNLIVRNDDGEFRLRWTNPKSIIQIINDVNNSSYEYYTELFYLFDWKKNNGDWNICPSPNDPNFNMEVHDYFRASMPNIIIDENGTSEIFFVT